MAGFLQSLKATHYKSFGSDPMGFDEILPLNLIVGRNNSGKSALIDLVEIACQPNLIPADKHHDGTASRIWITVPLTRQEVQNQFPQNTTNNTLGNLWQHGQRYVGKTAMFVLGADNKFRLHELTETAHGDALKRLKSIENPEANHFKGKHFRRLFADRDVSQETDNDQMTIRPNGGGLTNVIQRLLNKATLPSKLVDTDILKDLNEIFGPDTVFTDIASQQHDNGLWEIFLRQDQKGLISLSNSGSGLKTVLLVLSFFVCIPFIEKRGLNEFVFAFEELENNLHPALQRRLVDFIRRKSLETGCVVFLTTHSSAVIDLVSHDEDTQIIHVTHSGKSSSVRRATTYVHNRGVLDDLDVRASDLLQANGIVWVEGPSDRLYFNKWIGLISKNALEEGTHYQCVFYGGRLLAHLSGSAPFDAVGMDEAVKIFAVNRNAAILIDSDKRAASDEINSTKQKIIDAITELGSIAWVSQGKEIENYLSSRVISQVFPGLSSLSQFEELPDALEKVSAGFGKKFQRNKVVYAEIAAELTTEGDLDVMDLHGQLTKMSSDIAKWNGISPSWL